MATVQHYEHGKFDDLPEFDEAAACLVNFESTLRMMAQIVSARDFDDRVGLALLHRHFPMNPDERLVEKVSPEAGVSVGRPTRPHGSQMPHLFRATFADGVANWYPVEFVDISKRPDAWATYRWFTLQHELLDEVASTLAAEDALAVFGLSLSHGRDEIECGEDEVLVEETNAIARTLTMKPHKVDDLRGSTTATNWSVDGGEVRMRCTCQRDQSGSHQHFETN